MKLSAAAVQTTGNMSLFVEQSLEKSKVYIILKYIHISYLNYLFHAEGKSIILDAFALLGGNENLVYKILVELEGTSYR